MIRIGSISRRFLLGLTLAIAPWVCAYAGDQEEVEGTWQLVMRKLPDGTTVTPPQVQGRSTFKNGVNQVVVFWHTPDGKPASLSQISKWEWADKEVAATPMLFIFDDGSGKPQVYAVGGETKRSPVTRHGARVSFQHPLNAPFIVREGEKSVATLDGVFVDYWEKVK